MSYIRLTNVPTVEPITLDQAKSVLRVIDNDHDNTRIEDHIKEAREWVEKRIQQKIAASTWEVALDEFASTTAHIVLPFGPVQSITSIKYNDADNVEQTIAGANYLLNDVTIEPIEDWPVTWTESLNVVRIRFLTGYADLTLAPRPVIAATHLKIKELYDGDDASKAIHDLLTNYYTMVA